jgi:flagellar protein FliO/FliZ
MDANVAGLALRMIAALAVVVALLGLAARFARRTGLAGPRTPAPWARVEVLNRSVLSRSSSVAVIRVAGRVLLLGITDQSVEVLTELDVASDSGTPEVLAQGAAPARPSPNPLDRLGLGGGRVERSDGGTQASAQQKSLVDLLRERTVRRS